MCPRELKAVTTHIMFDILDEQAGLAQTWCSLTPISQKRGNVRVYMCDTAVHKNAEAFLP